MVSTFHGLELGKRGLMAGQAAISTTGHNLANANTNGYSRQQVNQTPSPALNIWTSGNVNPSQLGSGVLIDSITRVRDSFLDNHFRQQTGVLGEWSVKQETLSHLETIVKEPSNTGLNASLNQFWDAWQDLANEPDSVPARVVVIERAQAVLDTAQSIDRQMTHLKSGLNEQLTVKVNDANAYLQQIADINANILRTGSQANDLLDKRDVLIDELSKLVPITVKEQNGVYNISLVSDGTSLVSGRNIDAQITVESNFGGGELKGITDSIEIVESYQGQLNEMMKGFVYGEMTVEVPAGSNLSDGREAPADRPLEVKVNGINGLLQLGWSIGEKADGNVQPGAALFTGNVDSFSIASLGVNPEVKGDPRLLATSFRTVTLNGQQKAVAGNNDLAQLMGSLQNGGFTINEQSHNVNKYFQSLVSSLGSESRTAMNMVANYEAMSQATEGRRQSVMGVSLDEEMVNLVKFQHAYNAAARLVTATDQMLDTIINRMAAR